MLPDQPWSASHLLLGRKRRFFLPGLPYRPRPAPLVALGDVPDRGVPPPLRPVGATLLPGLFDKTSRPPWADAPAAERRRHWLANVCTFQESSGRRRRDSDTWENGVRRG